MLKLVNVSKYYSSNNVIALGLRKVNLEFHSNEFVAIVGESGSGKTTLLNVICGIDTYEEGEMYLHGEETSYFGIADMENYRKKYVAFVFQNFNLIDSYTVLQNVEAPLIFAGYPRKEIRPRALEIIRRVGLEKHIHHKATKLSGGQKQRVVIARALAKDAPIIAADEPTGNLDSEAAKQIIELLHEIAKDKLVIIVTHDYEQVKGYATRRIRIFDGEIVEDAEMTPTVKTDLPKIVDTEKHMRIRDFFGTALRNLAAVPKKTIMMVLVFALFSFFVALAYGAFNASMRDYEISYNYYFSNSMITRVVLRKTDKTAFTTLELENLLDDPLIETYVASDYVLDYYLGMQEDEVNEYGYHNYVGGYPFPLEIISDTDLAGGRMPDVDGEVVIATYDTSAETIAAYLGKIYWPSSGGWSDATSGDSVTIVGVVSLESIHLDNTYYSYFLFREHDFAAYTRASYLSAGLLLSTFDGVDNLGNPFIMDSLFDVFSLEIDDAVADGVMTYPRANADSCDPGTEVCAAVGTMTIEDYYQTRITPDITINYYETNGSENRTAAVKMNEDTYDAIFGDGVYQISVLAASDVGVEGLVRRLALLRDGLLTSKYKVFYPYDSPMEDEYSQMAILLSIIAATVILAVTLLASTLITYIIFRAIINTKLNDYAIFRTIGASQKMIQNFIYLENGLTAVVAYGAVLGVILYLQTVETALTAVIKFYTLGGYVILFLIVLVMAFLISRKYCRRVFKESVQRTLKAE